MTTAIIALVYFWLYMLIGTGVSVMASRNTALTGDQLIKIIALWPLVLVRYLIESVMEKINER